MFDSIRNFLRRLFGRSDRNQERTIEPCSVNGILEPTLESSLNVCLDFHYCEIRTSGPVIFEGMVDVSSLLRGFAPQPLVGDFGPIIPHLVFAVDCEGQAEYHSPIPQRHGRLLWGTARGFILNPDGINQVYSEVWNGTPNPEVEWLGDSGGHLDTSNIRQYLWWRIHVTKQDLLVLLAFQSDAEPQYTVRLDLPSRKTDQSITRCALAYIGGVEGQHLGAYQMRARLS